ncbi:hypothetical protein HCH_03534 [Hahella chejuensis KCTC 2396]|uniref:Uncharacterized protein n=1 Tax=Hahella chejuensis (strain KCTC 2396) TaxID=349521 RepID=Q2SGE7_HAHCH|nr:hypothetical protein HCH_03534 [Hahella chejuensis KCTC 2396]
MKYYKSYTESHDGEEGFYYCEVKNGLITRQINAFNNVLYWATPSDEYDEEYFFTDQPEFSLSKNDLEISSDEFLDLWKVATTQKPD